MAETEAEILEAAKRFIQHFGSSASTEAHKSLKDAIDNRDTEMISYWRDLIAALPRAQP